MPTTTRQAGLTPVPGQARLPPRRLRLHHLHRQLRPAARRRSSTASSEGDLVAVRPCCPATATSRAGSTRDVTTNYLASPPLVVAYALAGTMDIDLTTEPLGTGTRRQAGVPARPLARRRAEIARVVRRRDAVAEMFSTRLRATSSPATSRWQGAAAGRGRHGCFSWDAGFDLRPPPAVLRGHAEPSPRPCADIAGARVLALLGDSVTTDHISPAGSIKKDSPAGAVPDRARRRRRATSTPTARGAATTR